MRFLVDAQLPPILAQRLREAGYDVRAVREVGLREVDDSVIWRRAREAGLTIITKDEDFALRVRTADDGPVIVWLRIGNSSNAHLEAWSLPQVPEIVRFIEQGSRLVEVR